MRITRGITPGPQKVVIYGPEGIGKSTFASQFPDPVFIDTEGSTKHMDVARTPRPTSWTMLLDQVNYFIWDASARKPCGTLAIDTADWAEQLCVNEVCARAQKKGIEDFGYGKGYTYVAEEFGKLLNALNELTELGINIVVAAHAKMRKFEQPDELGAYDRWELKLQPKDAALLKEWCDMLLFANYKTFVVNVDGQGVEKGRNKAQGGKRVMYAAHHPCWDAKNRHGLPVEMPFEYAHIAHCIDQTGAQAPPQPEPHSKTTEPAATPEKPAEPELEPYTGPMPFDDSPPVMHPPKKPKQTIPYPNLPRALADLMLEYHVIPEDIQAAVASRGYYPANTPIDKYDPGFIEGVLVGAWPDVLKLIEQITPKKIPF